jgi:hypothetical protein
VEIEARQPVWLDSKTRRMPGSYRPGMVLEDRTDAKERKSYVIDRVHEDTRVLSLIDGDGVLTRMKIGISALTGVSSAVKPSAWPPAKNCCPWRATASTA